MLLLYLTKEHNIKYAHFCAPNLEELFMKDELNEIPHIYSKQCPVVHALEIIGGKWRIAIIWELSSQKSIRYNELKRRIPGITNIMLTRSLKALNEHGLVERIEYNKIPPHVEYSLKIGRASCRERVS